MVGYFNGHDKTVWVMVQGLVQTLLVRLPLAYYMSIQPDASLTKIGFAAPEATIFGIVLNVIFYLWMNRKQGFLRCSVIIITYNAYVNTFYGILQI